MPESKKRQTDADLVVAAGASSESVFDILEERYPDAAVTISRDEFIEAVANQIVEEFSDREPVGIDGSEAVWAAREAWLRVLHRSLKD